MLVSALTAGSLPGICAAAETTAADRATARAMLDDGYALLSKGDASGALKRFTGADALVGVPSTKLAMAKAQVALGALVEAHDTLTAALRIPISPDEPAALKRARAEAAELLAQTTPRICELTIVIAGAESFMPAVRVDGAVVPTEALVAPRRVNPGHHTIEASVNAAETSAVADLAEGEKTTVTLDLTAAIAAAAKSANGSGDAARGSSQRDASSEHGRSRFEERAPWILSGLSVGIVGAALGTATGVMALGRQSDAEANGCVANECPPPAHADVNAAKDLATLSTVAFVIAGVGIAGAVVAWIFPGRRTVAKHSLLDLAGFAGGVRF